MKSGLWGFLFYFDSLEIARANSFDKSVPQFRRVRYDLLPFRSQLFVVTKYLA